MLLVTLVIVGLFGFTPAYASGDSVTVESISYAETSAKADVKAESLAIVDGAAQLTWEEPNHTIKVTAKQLKKAPRIKVNATGANSSKVIYKKAKAKLYKKYKKSMPKWKAKKRAVKDADVVVLEEDSCVRNRGKWNKLPRGFIWCPDVPVVVKYDEKSDQYRHSHSLLTASNLEALKQELAAQDRLDELEVVGTVKLGGVTYFIVKWCLNYIGGDVIMLTKVIQVRYEHNLLMDIDLESIVDVSATVKASLQCPSGTLYGEASASASGYAAASITVMMKHRDSSVQSEKSRILTEARAKAKTQAQAAAQAKVKLECGSTPPPPPPPPPVDNLPSMQCHAAQHIWVGEDPMVAVFDLTDPDGTPVSFDKLEVTGPIEIVLTEDTAITDGMRRTITIRAASIPEGTEEAYSLKLLGSSGGKQTSCLAQGTVKNNDTGWKA